MIAIRLRLTTHLPNMDKTMLFQSNYQIPLLKDIKILPKHVWLSTRIPNNITIINNETFHQINSIIPSNSINLLIKNVPSVRKWHFFKMSHFWKKLNFGTNGNISDICTDLNVLMMIQIKNADSQRCTVEDRQNICMHLDSVTFS